MIKTNNMFSVLNEDSDEEKSISSKKKDTKIKYETQNNTVYNNMRNQKPQYNKRYVQEMNDNKYNKIDNNNKDEIKNNKFVNKQYNKPQKKNNDEKYNIYKQNKFEKSI